ncbi:MAG: sensor histidine kinase [Georgenia sp.]
MAEVSRATVYGETGWRAGVWPDVVLAAVITLGGQLELASSGQVGWHGLLPGMLLFGQTAPVAARRLAPSVAAAVGAAALAIEALASVPTNTLSGLVAALVLLYSLGRHAAGWRLVAVTTFTGVALAVHMVLLSGLQISDLAFAVIFGAAAWLTGRAMRRREQDRRRAEAEARNERAAAAAALDAAVVDERARIARELHDVVAHGMGVMVVQAAAAEQLLNEDPDSARVPLSAVRQTGQQALAEMRRLLGLLRDGGTAEGLKAQPGLQQLPGLVERLREAGMAVTFTVTGEPTLVPPGQQLCAYRIVQEALTNSLKHAGGAPAIVELQYRADALAVRVHNSIGTRTPEASNGAGHGLVGMRERVRLYGGTLQAGGRPDGSFLVDAILPTRA